MGEKGEQIYQNPDGKSKKGIWIVLAMLLMVGALAFLLFGINQFYMSIDLNGETETVLAYGQEWEEPGATVIVRGTLFLTEGYAPEDVQITVNGEVGQDLGEYTLVYSARNRWFQGESKRLIRVVDTEPPEITLVADPYLDLIDGKKYKEEGYKATDNYDGDLTDQVERQELYGKVLYTVTDSSGNRTTVERKVSYYDPLPPTILLEGAKTIQQHLGEPYEEPGFIALDNVDGDLTDQVIVEGEVNIYVPGIYSLQYKVSDTHGNWGLALRTVVVS